MTGFLAPHYTRLVQCWNDGGRGEVQRSAIAFPILGVIAFSACFLLPSLGDSIFSFLMELFRSADVTTSSGALSFSGIFMNNVRACTMILIYGLIPFVPCAALALGMNSMILGILAAHFVSSHLSLSLFFASLFPHALIELPALILAFGMSLYCCGQITRRCRRDQSAVSFSDCVLLSCRLLILVLLPLLLLAAGLEAYVTPQFISLFQAVR